MLNYVRLDSFWYVPRISMDHKLAAKVAVTVKPTLNIANGYKQASGKALTHRSKWINYEYT